MKKCPACQAEYADESLVYCLNDGAPLMVQGDEAATVFLPNENPNTFLTQSDEQQTVVQSQNRNPFRIDVQNQTQQVPQTPPATPVQYVQPAPKKSNWLFGSIIGILLLAVVGLGAIVVYLGFIKPSQKDVITTPTSNSSRNSSESDSENKNENNTSSNRFPTMGNTNSGQKPPTPSPTKTPSATPTPSQDTFKVNSPNDGFLALRTEPNSETGERITKIPHGANVKIINCNGPTKKIGNRTGQWCQVNYNGQTGWAFNLYLVK